MRSKTLLIISILIAILLIAGSCGPKSGYNSYVHETLPNGLNLIIKHNPDSRVFAINILGKNRSANEPEGKDGITDFVNRMLVMGADGLNADEIQNSLDDIGAEITANDNPYIPYDDRYTSTAYSFIKFETIDEYSEEGTKLLHKIVAKPDFPDGEISKIAGKVVGLLGMKSGSTYQNAREEFYAAIFKDHPYSKTIMGSRRSVMGFTRDDLVEYHKKFYAPNNMIIAVATNIDLGTVKQWIYDSFGTMEKNDSEYPVVNVPDNPKSIVEVHKEMDKEQMYIYMGCVTPGLLSMDAPAINMAASIISTRMRANLREKQGLAYSVGMGANLMSDFGWVVASMGTGYENYEIAKDGMIAEIENLKNSMPTEDELSKAQNSTWGSMLLARASRINQAYYMCRNEFLGVGYDYQDDYLTKIRKVTPADIQIVVNDYFDTEHLVIATAGKLIK
jgi:predicted Zn-dependent peptidase